jgi:DNA polymerase
VWCCAFCVDDGPIKLWTPGEAPPEEFVEASRNPDWIVVAFNDAFERLIEQHVLAPRYGWPEIPIERHRCLQAAALAQALPASLEGIAEALRLEHRKDATGAAVMKRLTQLRPGENPTQEELQQLYAYCGQDVAVERELRARIPALIPAEQELWQLDAVINERGIYVDRPLLDAAIQIADTAQRELNAELIVLTEADIQTVGQADRLLAWLAAHGCEVADLKKATLKAALRRKHIPPEARRVIEVRLAGAHAAAAKFQTLADWCGHDSRARGWSRYHGTATGRWTSFGVQLHNIKRPEVEDLEAAIAAVSTGSYRHVQERYPQPLTVAGDCPRHARRCPWASADCRRPVRDRIPRNGFPGRAAIQARPMGQVRRNARPGRRPLHNSRTTDRIRGRASPCTRQDLRPGFRISGRLGRLAETRTP